MVQSKRPKVLEVIVSSIQDAIEAQAGGADRLEVVKDLDTGGLTPDLSLVRAIAESIQIPLRVMLRENETMQLQGSGELVLLCEKAAMLNSLNIDGLVIGFLTTNQIDLATLKAVLSAAPNLGVTFHRAFDELPDPLAAIQQLKTVPQVDRILTTGGTGSWPERKLRLHRWQAAANPEITILAGAGVSEPVISDLCADPYIREIHIGRAARIPQQTSGKVCRLQVAQIKGSAA